MEELIISCLRNTSETFVHIFFIALYHSDQFKFVTPIKNALECGHCIYHVTKSAQKIWKEEIVEIHICTQNGGYTLFHFI